LAQKLAQGSKIVERQMVSDPGKAKQTSTFEKFIDHPELFFLAFVIFVTISLRLDSI